jgi:hypothetical protein
MSMRPGPGVATGASLQALVPALLARVCPHPRSRSRNSGHAQPVTGHGISGHGLGLGQPVTELPATVPVANANLCTPQPALAARTRLPRSFLPHASRATRLPIKGARTRSTGQKSACARPRHICFPVIHFALA